MSVINTNMKSLITQNNLTVNNRALSKAMEQLSTGKRINTAGDDAAGLAISNKMTAQIRGLNQSVRNANDGISMIQTAEGALTEVTNMLQRMRELAVQSANDTNTSSDRFAMDLEYQQLGREISRIATNTQWNAMNILNNTEVGQAGTAHDVGEGVRNVKFQVGANPNQVINIGLKDFSYNLGTEATQSESKFTLGNLSGKQNFEIQIKDQTISFSTSRKIGYDENLDTPLFDGNGHAITVMTEDELVDFTTQMKKAITDTTGLSNVSVTRVGYDIYVSDAEGRDIGSMGVKDGTTATSSITVTNNTSTLTLGNLNGKQNFALNFGGTDIQFSLDDPIATDTVSATDAGYMATKLSNALTTAGITGYVVTGSQGTLTINPTEEVFAVADFTSGALKDTVVDNNAEGQEATLGLQSDLTSSQGVTTFTLKSATYLSGSSQVRTVDSIKVGDQWVSFDIAPTGSVSAASVTDAIVSGLQSALDAMGGDTYEVSKDGTDPWKITIEQIPVTIAAGDFVAKSARFTETTISAGVEAVEGLTPNGNPNSVFSGSARLNDTNLKTQASSNIAVDRLDNAMANVDHELATYGSIMNRLTHAADNLTNISQNTQQSRSRILDTDYAAATTELARTQIIQQAGMAMLAQANQQPQTVLSLLQ